MYLYCSLTPGFGFDANAAGISCLSAIGLMGASGLEPVMMVLACVVMMLSFSVSEWIVLPATGDAETFLPNVVADIGFALLTVAQRGIGDLLTQILPVQADRIQGVLRRPVDAD